MTSCFGFIGQGLNIWSCFGFGLSSCSLRGNKQTTAGSEQFRCDYYRVDSFGLCRPKLSKQSLKGKSGAV